jgi:predicted DNA-binding transcriptional regulator AlpA
MKREELLAELARIEAARCATFAQLIAIEIVQREPEDRLLSVEEAARILGVTVDWLYRHTNDFSFTIRPGPGQVRFSRVGIQDYLRRKRR